MNSNAQHPSLPTRAAYEQAAVPLGHDFAAPNQAPYAFNFVQQEPVSVPAMPAQQAGLLYSDALPLGHGLPTTVPP